MSSVHGTRVHVLQPQCGTTRTARNEQRGCDANNNASSVGRSNVELCCVARAPRSWSPCWANECRLVAAREYGCALRQRQKEAAAAEKEEEESGSLMAGGGGGGGARLPGSGGSRRKSPRSERDHWDLETMAPGEWREDEGEGVMPLDEEGEEGRQECGTPFRHNLLQVLLWAGYCAHSRSEGRDGARIFSSAGAQSRAPRPLVFRLQKEVDVLVHQWYRFLGCSPG